jgi:Putative transmembrane protein (PGPGW)
MLGSILEWFQAHPAIFVATFVLSLVAIIVSMVLVPYLVIRIPADYLTANRSAEGIAHRRHAVAQGIFYGLKNLLAIVLILLGLIMLVTPGQGVITLLAGLALLDMPGKRRLERWIISQPPLLGAINKLRARSGRAPVELPAD